MIAAYIIAYIAAYIASSAGHYYLSGIILILTAAALYVKDYFRTGNIINLRGLFALSFEIRLAVRHMSTVMWDLEQFRRCQSGLNT